ncbi:MAG: PAS domain S-box protein [Anaerolineales bacterium]
MMEETIQVLSIEDNKLDCQALERLVEEQGLPYALTFAHSVAEARDILAGADFDVALVDYLLGDGTAFDLFDDLEGMPFIIVTGAGDESIAVEAMQRGAHDYLVKDPDSNYLITLPQTLEAALTHWRNEQQLARHREHLENVVAQRTAQLRAVNERLREEIAERKQAEAKVRELYRFRERIIDNANVWLDVLDREGNIVIWNKAAEEISGYPREKVVGHDQVWEWLYPDETYRQEIMAKVASIIEGEEVAEESQTTIRRKDGEERIISWHSSNLVDDEGQSIGSIAMGRDITEQVRAEEAREESERKFRTLFNNLSDAVFIHDLEGKFLEVNDVACQRLGYHRDELLRMGPQDIDAQEYTAAVAEHMEEIQQRGQLLFRTDHVTQDGDRIPTEVHSRLVKYNGQESVLSVARDISEREELEAQLRQAQKMESLGRLAGGIAHDFNNLLTVINGYSQLMLAEMPPDSPWREEAEQIERAGTRAGDLTRQVLAFSRRQILNRQTVQLNDLLLEMGGMLRRLIREDIELVTLPAPDLGLVKVDPAQMEQILTNLVVNASDAMSEKEPPGGTLTIATANETVDEEFVKKHPDAKAGEYVRLTVKDTGVGMTDEVKEHLFEPFFTTKEPGEGTGLGLATVYGIVKQHEGFIYIDSVLGQGTTVNIYCPRLETEHKEPSRRDEEGRMPGGTEEILLVEDEPSVLDFMRRALEELGYTVLEATNGEEALRTREEYEEGIDLLVTDVVMPQMDGRALVERMRTQYPQLKVLFVSGYADLETISPEDFDQRTEFLQKPFSIAALADKVRALLDV